MNVGIDLFLIHLVVSVGKGHLNTVANDRSGVADIIRQIVNAPRQQPQFNQQAAEWRIGTADNPTGIKQLLMHVMSLSLACHD